LGASVGDDLVNALNLATSQPVLDVQVEADERLREADRRVLLGRVWTAYVSTTCR
jgi:hypothetical protein